MRNSELLKRHNIDIDEIIEFWGDIDSYQESLKEFVDSLDSRLTDLEQFKNASDWNNYSILAHSIKSELKYLGLKNEAEIFFEHEQKGKENDGAFIEENYDKLKTTAAKIKEFAKEYLEEKKNLLIADDSDLVLKFLEKSISNQYNILKASTGKEVLDLIEKNSIYAILLDLNMPNIDGFEVLNNLKERKIIEEIPIVVITGDNTKETIQKALSYPILDVLNKPFDEKNIQKVLESFQNYYDQK